MSRYIDADALLKSEIKRCGCIPTIGSGYNDEQRFDFILQEQPTADVAEVVHGMWEAYPSSLYRRCSVCKMEYDKLTNQFTGNYCPNCGAKMDKEG